MKTNFSRLLSTFVGVMAFCSAPPAYADDSEVFTSTAFTAGSGVNANVLFVIDTSGSMDSEVVLYSDTVAYTPTPPAVACDTRYIYWQTGRSDRPPECTANNRFLPTSNVCRDAYLDIVADGWWSGRAAQLNSGSLAWGDLTAGVEDRLIECELDRGEHGNADPAIEDGGTRTYARSGSGTSDRWTSNRDNELRWRDRRTYSFYSGNYINWYNTSVDDLPDGERVSTRWEIVTDVAKQLIRDLEGVNLGLMRYSNNGGCGNDSEDNEWEARGGIVTWPIRPLTTANRDEMIRQIDEWDPEGWTPLSETLYEAYLYLKGGNVLFGAAAQYPSIEGADYRSDCRANSNGDFRYRTATHNYLSHPGSKVGGTDASTTYDSPMDFSCQQTFIVYLTDGLPTQDTEINGLVNNTNLPGFSDDGRVPYIDPDSAEFDAMDPPPAAAACPAQGPSDDTHGRCMINLAGYMNHHDLRTDVLGSQTVTTYVVGFGNDIAESQAYLQEIAAAGGGEAYTQGDRAGLKSALEEIFAEVRRNVNTTFVSPTVAVNAFNRTRNLDTLFLSVFAPTNKYHWPGNLKKYKLLDGIVVDKDNAPALDTDTDGAGNEDTADGFIAKTATDLFNQGSDDGPDVRQGGAASRLPDWDARKVYTYLGGTNRNLYDAAHAFAVANTGIRNDHVGATSDDDRTAIIEFTLGLDNNDSDGDLSTTNTRKAMGDPMHSRPAVAIYSGSEESPVGTVYTTTNDGMLHAFDMNDGEELWAFIPVELMPRLAELRRNRTMGSRSYGLDGDVRIFKYDVNGNGLIDEADDKMYALFGFGRGGGVYYALDITSRTQPKFLWKKDNRQLPMLGQAWSTPQITRVNVEGQSDPQKFVVIFGAGYDTTQENYQYVQDTQGTGLYMLELTTGNLLWSGGRTGTDWTNAQMTNAIPADVTVLDLNGDTFGDRMYVGDMGGRIWRFDIWHGQPAASLVTGGVFATLGVGHTNPTSPDSLAVLQQTRRFYNATDVSLVTPRGAAPYFNIAIGSGYRGHPLEKTTRDRFYSLRDYRPFERLLDSAYTSPITDSALVDVTTDVNVTIADGSPGWKIELRLGEAGEGDGWNGEKVLGDSVTVGGVIFFPTFTPVGLSDADPCLAATRNRTWAVYIDSARPFGLLDGQDPGTGGEEGGWANDPRSRWSLNPLDGIAPGTAVIMGAGGNCTEGGSCEPVCLVGASTHKCPKVGGITRTFWERRQ